MKKLVVGFTDVILPEDIVWQPPYTIDSKRKDFIETAYTLKKSRKDLSKSFLEWKFINERCETHTDLVMSTIHTKDINIQRIENSILPDINDYNLELSLRNLIPLMEDPFFYTPDDYSSMSDMSHEYWGDLYINELLSIKNYYGFVDACTFTTAYNNNNTSFLKNKYEHIITSNFAVNFNMKRRGENPEVGCKMKKEKIDNFILENKDSIISAGFEIDDPKLTLNSLRVGSLLSDKTEAYNILQNFPYICSIETNDF